MCVFVSERVCASYIERIMSTVTLILGSSALDINNNENYTNGIIQTNSGSERFTQRKFCEWIAHGIHSRPESGTILNIKMIMQLAEWCQQEEWYIRVLLLTPNLCFKTLLFVMSWRCFVSITKRVRKDIFRLPLTIYLRNFYQFGSQPRSFNFFKAEEFFFRFWTDYHRKVTKIDVL